MEEKKYFKKEGKTEEELALHKEELKKRHRERMKKYYKDKKKEKNMEIRHKFDELYNFMLSLGGTCKLQDLDDNLEKYSALKYKCLCFDKIYEAFGEINSLV